MKKYIAAIDIGKKNFAFVVEEIGSTGSIGKIAKASRYHKTGTKELIGTPTKEFESVLDKMYEKNKVILVSNNDLTVGAKNKTILEEKIYINMMNVLSEHTSYWDQCEVILIEKQMAFGPQKQNIMAVKLAQHCYSYFMFYYRDKKNKPNVIEYPAYMKTQVLGAPKHFGTITKHYKNGKTTEVKDNRKKWAARMASKILTIRNDMEHLEMIETKHERKQQQDDMSDCLLMVEAYCVDNYL
mgnify:CR=1 FL=1